MALANGKGGFVRVRAFVVALGLAAGAAEAVSAAPLRLTLDDALERAKSANASLRIARQDIAMARASLERSSAWVPSNPFFSGGLLQAPQTGFARNYGVSLSQEFEVAGQRSRRMTVAASSLHRSEWDQRYAELNVAANVKLAFQHALLARERVALAERGLDRLNDLGSESPPESLSRAGAEIERNLFAIQQARAQREVRAANQALEAEIANLRYLLALPPEQPLEPTGAVSREIRPLPPEAELAARALTQRPDLVALRFDAERAAEQIPLVKREAVPNLTVQASVSRFDDDTFAGGDISFYLPVARSSEPELLEALADRERSDLALEDLERTIEREVRDARRACVAAAEDLALVQDVVVPRSRENLELQRERFESDEVGTSELIAVLADAQYAEREAIDALQIYVDAWIELERTVAGAL